MPEGPACSVDANGLGGSESHIGFCHAPLDPGGYRYSRPAENGLAVSMRYRDVRNVFNVAEASAQRRRVIR